ncbi:homocysteine S-methyltransferase 1-like [Macadamia integrifolia]|uniref:homocysteine S-methyltransferase 1-like n=1 Tax=Macadamia integrifolia TaxID=60698 RepID=UPI001C4F4259|nr:homocysteine S-methyltransferase 1-like [Macadamia integrifolia]
MEDLICKFKKFTRKTIVVYPNSGEVWDGRAKRWKPSECFDDDMFKLHATRWRDSGAKLIGGCCRTTPSTIKSISKVLKKEDLERFCFSTGKFQV